MTILSRPPVSLTPCPACGRGGYKPLPRRRGRGWGEGKTHGVIRYCILFLAAAASSALAGEPPAAPERAPYAVGGGTDALLARQREGRQAGKPLPIPAAEAEPSRKRYLDSFSRPIPDKLLTQQGSYAETK